MALQGRSVSNMLINRATPIFEHIFAKKEQAGSVPQIRLVTIWFGTNDACLPNTSGQHVPLETFRSNLTAFLENLTSASSPYAVAHTPLSIVLITPPAMYKPMMESSLSDPRKEEVTKQYVDVVNELAAEWSKKGREEKEVKWRVEGVDMWKGILDEAGEGEGLKEYFTDGLHLSTKGYAVFWKQFAALVRGPLKGRGLDWDDLKDCPPRLPLWDEVDPNRPESVIEGMKHAPFRSS